MIEIVSNIVLCILYLEVWDLSVNVWFPCNYDCLPLVSQAIVGLPWTYTYD